MKPFEISEMERTLANFYQAPAPDTRFAVQLEQRLRARPLRAPIPQRRSGWLIPATVALLLLLSMVAIGPQQVWATFQHLLGYVPHFGFVESAEVLVLPEPVSRSVAGFQITVEQLVSAADNTTLIFLLRGDRVPSLQQLREESELSLVLPDGTRLPAQQIITYSYTSSFIKGQARFPALPTATRAVTVEIIPQTTALTALNVPLQVRPAARPGFTNAYIEPHTPFQASATAQGITLEAAQVVYAPEATVVQLSANAPWQIGFSDPTLAGDMTLHDQTGRAYPRFYSALAPQTQAAYAFLPLHAEAQRLTLHIPQATLQLPLSRTLEMDWGEQAAVGQRLPLTTEIVAADVEIRLTEVALATDEGDFPYSLRFTIQSRAADLALRVQTLALADHSGWHNCETQFEAGGSNESYCWIGLSDLPTGKLQVTLSVLEFVVEGPWDITWALPQ